MSERSRIATNVQMSNRRYRSRSSSVSKENKKPTPLLRSQQISEPHVYTNAALNIENVPPKPRKSLSSNSLNQSGYLSSTVEDAVRKALHSSLQDLHQNVDRIHRTLSEMSEGEKAFIYIAEVFL